MFAQAGQLAPKNALPCYLEAAALAQLRPSSSEGLQESFVLVAKANDSGNPVTFPPPLWFPDLPDHGMWYAKLQRQIVDECCALLYQYVARVVQTARTDVADGHTQYWDSWLETVQKMGERLLQATEPGTVQATAGVRIQLDALTEQQHTQTAGREADKAILARLEALGAALDQINSFEDERDNRIRAEYQKCAFPRRLVGVAGALLFLALLLSSLVNWLFGCRPADWTASHPERAFVLFAGSFGFFVTMLVGTILVQRSAPWGSRWFSVLAYVWFVGGFAITAGGPLYPLWAMPRKPVTLPVGTDSSPENQAITPPAKRNTDYASFLRRYFGIQTGLFLCAASLWAIVFRVVTDVYPWDTKLLVTGLVREETELVRQVLTMLSSGG